MANTTIPNLPATIALNGTEQLEAVQNGTSVRVTASQIASLAQNTQGTVTQINTAGALTGGPITTTGTISLPPDAVTNVYLAEMPSNTLKANLTGLTANPTDVSPSAVLDTFGSSAGSMLYRDAGVWTALSPGSSGYYLTTTGSQPQWTALSVSPSDIQPSGVTPGTYGTASQVGQFTVAATGQVTSATNVPILIPSTQVTGLGTMATQNANNVIITGGTMNGVVIGASSAAQAYFTTISSGLWNGSTIAIGYGGTGATTASGARTNLGLGSMAVQNANSVTITGGTIDNVTIGGSSPTAGTFSSLTVLGNSALATITSGSWNGNPIQIAYGGTGATNASNARFNLGAAASGANSDITSLSGLTTPISTTQGGTGFSSYTTGDILYATSSNSLGRLNDVVVGNVLKSGGVGLPPAYGKVSLTADISGTLPVSNGGTGAATLSGYVYGNGTSVMTASPTIPTTALDYNSLTIGSTIIALGGSAPSLNGVTTLTLTQDPTAALQAATKQYVDNQVATVSNLTYHTQVDATTTANLNATYNNGVSGVGATLTNAGAFAQFSIDSYTPSLNARVLIKNQTSAAQNGIYVVTTQGDAISVPWVLTRATDFNTPASGPNGIQTGASVFVQNGTTWGATSWVMTTTGTIVVGTTALNWTQISSAGNITVTSPLSKAGNVISLGTVPVTLGGTGLTSYTVGDLVYANTATSLAPLSDVATGNVLRSGGVNNPPAWGKLDLTTDVTGTLPVANGGTGTSTALTQGSVVFAGASGTYSQNNANFYWDNVNTRLGIHTNTPDATLTVMSETQTAVPPGALPSGTDIHVIGADNAETRITQDAFGTGNYPAYTGRHARGTAASPTASQADDVLSQYTGRGYGSSTYNSASTGVFQFQAAENFTNTAQGTYASLRLTATGSVSPVEVMRFGPVGQLGVGGSSYGSANQLLTSGGTGAAPSWQSGINITTLTTSCDALINSATVGRGAGSVASNTAVGASGLAANTIGSQNTAVGASALRCNTTTSNNTAVGFCALFTNTSGDNTAVGNLASAANTTGGCNTAIGSAALRCNTTGAQNTAVGFNALFCSTGDRNTAVGHSVLPNNTTGSNNVAIGGNDGNNGSTMQCNTTGLNNVAVGNAALFANTSGCCNIAIGLAAMVGNTTGNSNIAIGRSALLSNTTPAGSVAVGNCALICSNAACNTAVGADAGFCIVGGTFNTAVGGRAGRSLTTGVSTLGAIVGGSGYVDGTYSAVQLTLSSGTAAAAYPTADITVSGGAVTAVTLVTRGIAFRDTTTVLTAPNTSLGGSGAGFTVAVASLVSAGSNVAVGACTFQATTGSTGINNVAVGTSAQFSNTTGNNNVGVGTNSLLLNTTGACNVGVGTCALRLNTTGSQNVSVGFRSNESNTTGGRNTFVGDSSGIGNTTGSYNVGVGYNINGSNASTGDANIWIGYQSGRLNTSGALNTYVGGSNASAVSAGESNTTGSCNAGFGAGALGNNSTGAANVSVGYRALFSNSTASNNVAVGAFASCLNTTGTGITSLGYEAGFSNATSNNNTAIGFCALRANTAADNTAVGACAAFCNTTGIISALGLCAGFNNTTGSSNTAIGLRALRQNQTGSSNTAVGQDALFSATSNCNTGIGHCAAYGTTTGICNTAFGHTALVTNSTGSCNVALGNFALACSTTADANVAVGTGASRSNTTGTNNTSVGHLAAYSNSTSASNTAIGTCALYLSTGGSNTAVGSGAAQNNTTGCNNVVVGGALANNSTGNFLVAVGSGALNCNTTANCNTAVGYLALQQNTIGTVNTGIGAVAGRFLTSGVNAFGTIVGGSGYVDGTYSAVQLTYSSGSTAITYPTADITVSGGAVTAVTLVTRGTGFKDTTTVMSADAASLGGSGAGFTVAVSTLLSAAGNTAVGFLALGSQTTACNNTAVGQSAGACNTTGNIDAFGFNALLNNTTGSTNAAFGQCALRSNTTGIRNTAIGCCALFTNSTGCVNIAIGDRAGLATSTGCANVFIGPQTGVCNTTGTNNVFIGAADTGLSRTPGWCNTTGTGNVAVGSRALITATASANTAIGDFALCATSSGICNTAVGYCALRSNTTADTNVAVGALASCSNTTGTGITSLGFGAGFSNLTSNNITALGFCALYANTAADNTAVGNLAACANTSGTLTAVGSCAARANTTGTCNVAVGTSALTANTTGANNTAVGMCALGASTAAQNTAVGANAGLGTTSGACNTFIGSAAGQSNTTGNLNAVLGQSSLLCNTTGSCIVSIGASALTQNTTASCSVGVGVLALACSTIGLNNTAVGAVAGRNLTSSLATFGAIVGGSGYTDGTYNSVQLTYSSGTAAVTYPIANITVSGGAVTAVALVSGGSVFRDTTTIMTAPAASIGGTGAGFTVATATLTTASNNTAIGVAALGNATSTGSANTAVGVSALQNNTSGICNVTVGVNGLIANTTGGCNVALGTNALCSNTTGAASVAVGFLALGASNANSNTAIGCGSLRCNTSGIGNTAVGQSSGLLATTGSNNTFIGLNAGCAITTGACNTLLGGYNGNQGGLDIRTANNYIVLSDGAGNPRQIINNNGNVGINTTTVSYDTGKVGSTHKFLNLQADASSYAVNTLAGNQSAAGNRLGLLAFVNDTNSATYKYSAWILSETEGSTANQLGGRIVLSTTGDASSAGPLERMRITSAGEVLVGGTTALASTEGVISLQRTDNPASLRLFRNDTSIVTNNGFGTIAWYGNDTTSNTPTLHAYISADASGDHAAGDNPTDIVFATTPDGSATFAEAGRITQAGSYVLKGGTTTAAAGVGIIFPATQVASANANSLDDYEEGAWTPVIADAATGGNASSTVAVGTYTKVGRLVTATCSAANIDTTGLTAGNALYIRGLPFTAYDTPGITGYYVCATYFTGNVTKIQPVGIVVEATTYVTFANIADTVLVSALTSTSADIWFTLTYEV